METQTARVLNVTATLAGFAVGYMLVAKKLGEDPHTDKLRYHDEDALRRAQARGMARDYREMELCRCRL